MNFQEVAAVFGPEIFWSTEFSEDGKPRRFAETNAFTMEMIGEESLTIVGPPVGELLFAALNYCLQDPRHGMQFLDDCMDYCESHPNTPYTMSVKGFVLTLTALPRVEAGFLHRLKIEKE